MSIPGPDHFAHFDRLARLLTIESQAAEAQVQARQERFAAANAEKSGLALTGLVVAEVETGLGGRWLVTLRKGRGPLPWTALGPGAPVRLTAKSTNVRGIVATLEPLRLTVALDDLPAALADDAGEDDLAWRLDVVADEVTEKRCRAALSRAKNARQGERLAELRQVLLGLQPPRFDRPAATYDLDGFALNDAQRAAVLHALSAQDVAIIHGPPGTGKTTTVVALIAAAVANGERVLATAPSNLAVDNILERLIAAGVDAVRIGHPARVVPELRARTLDYMVADHEDCRLARQRLSEAQKLFRQADRFTRAKPEPGQKAAWRREARALLADARQLEDRAASRILANAKVICATAAGVDSGLLPAGEPFDVVVLDEAAQATEPMAWIPIGRARRLVLAGDHCQLPPTIVSQEAKRAGLGISLLERLAALPDAAFMCRLDVQYRMHEAIMRFPADEFYDGTLTAAPAVAAWTIGALPPLALIDTAGAGYDDELEADGESRINRAEAKLAAAEVRALLADGVEPGAIAVITPYAGQARTIRQELEPDAVAVEVDTVDGFQGREKDAVVISCVRSNGDGALGFLAETRRFNVALTRAKKRLIILGDGATLANDAFFARLWEYADRLGAIRSVWEVMPPL